MRFPVASLSRHAEERLGQRSTLTPAAFLQIMNRQYGKRFGASKARSHLIHRLYWSPADEAFFVAIQDVIDGTVVTILTFEMYGAHFGQNITPQRLSTVINQMVVAGDAQESFWCTDGNPKNVLVYASVSDRPHPVALGAWKATVEGLNLGVLGTQQGFWRWIADKISARGVALESVEYVTARLPGGDHQYLEYAC